MPQRKVIGNRAARHRFLANAIVTDIETEEQIAGLIRNLSLSGCYIETAAYFGTRVKVRLIITHNGQKLRALGEVAHGEPNKGMGIFFTSLLPDDETVLERWLEQPW